MSEPSWTVTINGPRGEEWTRVLGRNTLPVKSPLTIPADLPGHPDAQVYMLDIEALTPAEFRAVVVHLSGKFKTSALTLADELRRDGLPILADDDCTPPAIPLRYFT